MKYKYEKCKKCTYDNRRSVIYPCNECKENEKEPIACYHCRYYMCNPGRKSIRPCNKFEWD